MPRALSITDALVIAVAMSLAQVLLFGPGTHVSLSGSADTNYWIVTGLIALAWWIGLEVRGSRDVKILGAGAEEYKRVLVTSLYLFGLVAIFSYALDLSTSRGYVAAALPIGIVLLLFTRWLHRQRLIRHRRNGKLTRRLLLVGGPSTVEHLHRNLSASPEAGYHPVAAILPGFQINSPTGEELPIPVAGVSANIDDVLKAVTEHQADAIAISAGSSLKPRVIRELGWELRERGVSMIVAPALTDIAGPRIHTQPVAGLPLIHVSTPKLEGGRATVKRAFDMLGSGALVLLLSPVLLVIGLLVKLSSPGPVFYSQERIGQDGIPFRMYKFRSMVVDADSQLQALLAQQGTSDKPLFKVENDPRITPIGRFIRQYSLDELPQLFNVVNGSMSLVGPRPQRQGEVDLYDDHAHRRLLVKPGMSGLWQVSGRSNLSWEEAIRLDLYYVENWSLMQDVMILFRTAKAVVAKDGAY